MQTYTVELLELSPHPEGGYVRETFRASQRARRDDDTLSLHDRAAGHALRRIMRQHIVDALARV